MLFVQIQLALSNIFLSYAHPMLKDYKNTHNNQMMYWFNKEETYLKT